MVRIAVVFALAAAVGAERSSVEIAALNARDRYQTAMADFDHEAADTFDWDEELEAGDYKFEESDEQKPGFHGPQVGFQGGNMAGSFMVADGCRRSQGSRNPEIRNAMGGFASVRCCSNNGRRCESTSIGCLQHQTLSQASAACSRRNMRLCSVPELDSGVCCGTGCGFDGHFVWTMTPAGGGFSGQNQPGFHASINIGNNNGQFNGQHGFSGSTFNGGGFHNQVQNFVVADGCLRSGGRQNARTQSAISGRASVRCCSFDGRRCETQTVGCLAGVNYNQANQACSSRGLRLCSQQELQRGVCCGTGCGFDGRRVWTNTPAR